MVNISISHMNPTNMVVRQEDRRPDSRKVMAVFLFLQPVSSGFVE